MRLRDVLADVLGLLFLAWLLYESLMLGWGLS